MNYIVSSLNILVLRTLFRSLGKLAFGICLLGVSGCENSPATYEALSEKLARIGERVDGYTDEAKKLPDLAEGEYEKLFRIDYKVLEIQLTDTPELLEETLGLLGKERWECFHIEPKGPTALVFCKRRPQSYIRYLGHLF